MAITFFMKEFKILKNGVYTHLTFHKKKIPHNVIENVSLNKIIEIKK